MVAELCRLGLVAAPFAGNVPHYDVIGSEPRCAHLAVQAKTIQSYSLWLRRSRTGDPSFHQMNESKCLAGQIVMDPSRP